MNHGATGNIRDTGNLGNMRKTGNIRNKENRYMKYHKVSILKVSSIGEENSRADERNDKKRSVKIPSVIALTEAGLINHPPSPDPN
jgi:hypothetical protein